MLEVPEQSPSPGNDAKVSQPEKPARRSRRRLFLGLMLIAAVGLVAARAAMPSAVRWYVNDTINRSPLYEGRIGDIDIHLWRGAYTIHDVRLLKRNGDVPVPFFQARDLDLGVEWKNLLHRRIVGRVVINQPVINFVDAPDPANAQAGVGPWLQILRDLFPFRINSTELKSGTVHFRAYQVNPPMDVYLSHIDGTIDNVTNIYDETTPMYATVNATGLAMDQARFQYKMKLDPFSYRPSFQVALRLMGLDVTKVNQLSRTYGKFDFEHGWFDLVIDVNAKEGTVDGYIKPLFRNLVIFSPQDLKEDNIVELFWEALLGVTTNVLKNGPRDQFGTVIPFTGMISGPNPDLLAAVGNVLRNGFIRAYLPRLESRATDPDEDLHFEKGSIVEPVSVGDVN
jgi:hypothetical protein